MTADEPLWSTAETAAFLGVPEQTLRYWKHRNRGEGPPWVKIGHHVKYVPADVRAYVDRNRVAS